jgi:transcriptional regulator GlxA family with amidase domain
MSKTFGILLFPDMEVLDFTGPLEAFGMFAKYVDKEWQVITVAETKEPVLAIPGLRTLPDHSFDDCPPLDVLLIPGGLGTRTVVDDPRLIDFVRRTGREAQWVTSVCTGAFVLERAGFLEGRKATTYWSSRDRLRELGVDVVEERFVHDGNVITAAGVSAGIDMTLYLIGQIKDPETARSVQKLIEYYPEPPFAEEALAAAGKETA